MKDEPKIQIASKWSRVSVDPNKVSPSYRERKATNDVAMFPDRGFTKQLQTLDPELEVVWDWASAKWEIWRFPKDRSEAHHVLTVQTKGKTYRELGTDILLKLQQGSYLANMTLNQLVNYFDELDNQVLRRRQRDMYNAINSITMETLNYQRGVQQVQVPRNMKIRRAITGAY